MIANSSIQQHTVCLYLSCRLCQCAFCLFPCLLWVCLFGWGGGGCCWWAVAGCWCLASQRVRVSCLVLCSCFCRLCLFLTPAAWKKTGLVANFVGLSAKGSDWDYQEHSYSVPRGEIFGFVSKRTILKAFATDVFIDQERR